MKDPQNILQSNENINNVIDTNFKLSPTYAASLEGQRKMAMEFNGKSLKLGDKWYLINSDWYIRWLKYIGFDSTIATTPTKNIISQTPPNPGEINNRSLFLDDEKNQLKSDLQEEIDYSPVPEELWNFIKKIYPISNEKDIIERVVINDSLDEYETSLRIELYKLNVNLSCSSNWKKTAKTTVTEEMSRQTTLEDIIEKMRNLFEIPSEKKVRLFFKTDDKNMTLISISPKATLNSTGYGVNDTILVDVQEEDGTWFNDQSLSRPIASPPPPPPYQQVVGNNNSSQSIISTRHPITTRSFDNSYSNRHHEYKPGLCGLSNLGNTCFMNSSIQCMSNVPLLTDYFREGRYKNEINKVNPLGRKGEIAEAYADLINEMWSGNNNYTIPRNFKLNLSRFAPQFTGFQQQDSHELLAFLLDGLHEDLNRIIKKPYVELGSHVGKTDEQFAEESWQDHKKRNDSIIVDIFHGLLKSTLNCLECNEISIKFDPFCYLSVPLPSKKERLIEIFFVPVDSSQPITKYKLSVIKNGTIGDLCAALEVLMPNVPKSHMMVCDVYTNKFFKVYEPNEHVSSIRDRDDIYIYELVTNYNNQEFLRVKLHLREKSSSLYNSSFFGLPLYYLVPRTNLTNNVLYQTTFQHLKRFLKDINNITNDEINSKLNISLNVNDEEEPRAYRSNEIDIDTNSQSQPATTIQDDEEDDENLPTTSLSQPVRSSQRLKNKSIQQNRVFNLILCKNDNIDFDNSHMPLSMDDSTFEWPIQTTTISYGSSRTSELNTISLIADFGSTTNKRIYNKKTLEEIVEHSSCNSQLIKKKDVISLSDCFNLYTKIEKLDEQDYWYCAKCKNHQPSTKKFDLWSLPPVLVVHLKRFSYSRTMRDKIDTQVEFPLNDLDMSSYLINKKVAEKTSTKYNLIAVSNHYGSLGGGHYTAYGKNRYDDRWYYFDDSSVSGSDESNVCTNAAYLLIYLRQDLHDQCIGSNAKRKETNNINNNSNFNNSTEKMDY